MVTRLRLLVVLLLATFVGAGACRDPDELLESVNAVVLVVGASPSDLIRITVGGETRQSRPDDNGVAEFKLSLPDGSYTGTVRVERAEGDGDDDDDLCGTFTLDVVAGAVDSAGVILDDLPACGDDDDDGEEGEGEEGEGEEGEGEEGEGEEGEGEEGEGEEGEGEEGEGEPDAGEGEGDTGEGEGEEGEGEPNDDGEGEGEGE